MRQMIISRVKDLHIHLSGYNWMPLTHTALPRQKEVMTIFMLLRYGTKKKFCLTYPIFNQKFRLFDVMYVN